jgi:hypothetical protein
MVIADELTVKRTGYTYQKKVSDSFDPSADYFTAMTHNPVSGFLTDDDFAASISRLENEMAKIIRDAAQSGEAVNSTIKQDELDSMYPRHEPLSLDDFKLTGVQADENGKRAGAGEATSGDMAKYAGNNNIPDRDIYILSNISADNAPLINNLLTNIMKHRIATR